jgi:benzoyl-CoA reductase/2-hydroxyglutaryl-CoA dehydratase subunit BcrC/BadD/HgdB
MMITQNFIIDDDKYNALKMHIKQMLKDIRLLETLLDNKIEKKTVRKIVTIINAELSHLLIKESQAK